MKNPMWDEVLAEFKNLLTAAGCCKTAEDLKKLKWNEPYDFRRPRFSCIDGASGGRKCQRVMRSGWPSCDGVKVKWHEMPVAVSQTSKADVARQLIVAIR